MKDKNLNIFSLPFLPIPERDNLPNIGAVYFVLSKSDSVEYIGKAKNLHRRWKSHQCCMELDSPKTCRVAWIQIEYEKERSEMEKRMIHHFFPRNNINLVFKPPKAKPKKPRLKLIAK